ncbi:hypothetical protein BDY19DRAFT_970616 [Irpex rosettiformis]|uniref:Uncharacterized protein n=1 Tax=Irpex rosettiformis TaxID=378272 RepID=A0ACB8TR52_9APHY|nr:hypothetical protein BDY19DRAFT_970616 [Irpex rosettiformis]
MMLSESTDGHFDVMASAHASQNLKNISAIGGGINAIVSAIANVIMTIVSVIVTIIVTIIDVIIDILCCNCFGGRRRRTGTHRYNFGGRRRGVGSTY